MSEPGNHPADAACDGAWIRVGTCDVRYVRGAASPAVLLLAGAAAPDTELEEALATRGRVIAPAHPAPPAGGETGWLRELIDGLGLERPVIVADSAWAACVLAFALRDPGRVARLAVLFREDADEVPGLPSQARLDATGHPVLLLPLDDRTRAAGVEALLDFVGRSEAASDPRY